MKKKNTKKKTKEINSIFPRQTIRNTAAALSTANLGSLDRYTPLLSGLRALVKKKKHYESRAD